MTHLQIRVTPNAKRSEIVGWNDENGRRCLRIKLAAPPVEGKANKALIEFLARTLEVRKSAIGISTGLRARVKTVRVDAAEDEVLRKLPR